MLNVRKAGINLRSCDKERRRVVTRHVLQEDHVPPVPISPGRYVPARAQTLAFVLNSGQTILSTVNGLYVIQVLVQMNTNTENTHVVGQ